MPAEILKQTVDYLVREQELFPEEEIIFDFTGGEPLLEIGLIHEGCEYIATTLRKRNHRWADRFTFRMTTNGILYGERKVQEFIAAFKNHLDLKISLDGTQEKHDSQRVYPDGSGSYRDVVRAIPLYLEQFPDATIRATAAPGEIPLLSESVLHCWDMGIKNVIMNIVIEDVYTPGDEARLERQLMELADRLLERKGSPEYRCSFFAGTLYRPVTSFDGGWCGAGRTMLAVDSGGLFYPCHRFCPGSLETGTPVIVGDCFHGLDLNRLRPFQAMMRDRMLPKECRDCDIGFGCPYCLAFNHEAHGTLYRKTTYSCGMVKAIARANRYLRERSDLSTGPGQPGRGIPEMG
jgi:uncharacterized protein